MDFRTVAIWNSILFISVSLLLSIIYFINKPRQNALLYWGAAYGSLVIGAVALSVRDRIPEFISIATLNILLILFYPLFSQGLRVLRGKPAAWKIHIAVLACALAWFTFFYFAYNSTALRALFFSVALAGYSFAFAFEVMSKTAKESRAPRQLIAAFSSAVGILYVLRFFLVLVNGMPQNLLAASGWETLIHSIVPMFLFSMAIPLIFLIVDRLNTELASALNEKDILLREMTHRIKNDLTLVDSLISIQQNSETEERNAKTYDSLRKRIRAIAAAHDQFSRHKGNIGKIDLQEYFDIIADGLPYSPMISVERHFASVEVPFKTALYLGLLLNELATNAIKYAFPNGEAGKIRLSFTMNGSVGTLVVADEGIGTTWPPKNSGGIGSMIIESMVHSVKGKLRYEGAGGSSFAVDVAVGGAAEARSV